MDIYEELDSLELPGETPAYRLERYGGRTVAVEKRRELVDPDARLFVKRMGPDVPADVGFALERAGMADIIGEDTLVAVKVNLGGGVTGVPSSFTDMMVVDGVIDAVRSLGGRPFICEANMRTQTMNRRMLVNRGVYPLMVRKGVEFVNLSKLSGVDFLPLCWRDPIHLARPLLHPGVKVVSVPALKHHWECGVTLAQKNMYGAIAERQKSLFHRGGAIDETVAAAARAVTPDISLLAHRQVGGRLGPHFCVPVDFGYIVASDNMLAADRFGCGFMGTDWRTVKHLQINCGGREVPCEPAEGSDRIEMETVQRIARTSISRPEVWFWRALLYPQYFVPHRTQYEQLFKVEPIGTALNWLFFHTRGDPWPSRWKPEWRPGIRSLTEQ